jgi:hypothetical protein
MLTSRARPETFCASFRTRQRFVPRHRKFHWQVLPMGLAAGSPKTAVRGAQSFADDLWGVRATECAIIRRDFEYVESPR